MPTLNLQPTLKPFAPLSRSLWGLQVTQVANTTAFAKFRILADFAVDNPGLTANLP
jgi:hypothetical protein